MWPFSCSFCQKKEQILEQLLKFNDELILRKNNTDELFVRVEKENRKLIEQLLQLKDEKNVAF